MSDRHWDDTRRYTHKHQRAKGLGVKRHRITPQWISYTKREVSSQTQHQHVRSVHGKLLPRTHHNTYHPVFYRRVFGLVHAYKSHDEWSSPQEMWITQTHTNTNEHTHTYNKDTSFQTYTHEHAGTQSANPQPSVFHQHAQLLWRRVKWWRWQHVEDINGNGCHLNWHL